MKSYKIRARKDLLIHLLFLCQHKFVPKNVLLSVVGIAKLSKGPANGDSITLFGRCPSG